MTPVGVPAELFFELPASMLDSRKIEQRIQPYSQSTYSTAGQISKFTIPQTDRTLVNGQTMYLTGQVDFGNLGTVGTNTYAVLGSYYSMFSRQVVNANGTVLETIERPGELVNLLINMTMNASEREAQSNSFGTNQTGNVGDLIINVDDAAAVGIAGSNNRSLSFAIPIIGIFDAAKYIPMWNSNIDLELTINALSNWLTIIGGTFSTTASFTLSNLELVFDSIELSPESFEMIMAGNPQKIVIKTNTYLAGTGALASGVSGGQDISINARLSSMKQLFFYFNQASCADQTFGGVNPNGNDVVFITNGKYYPQRPVKLTNPSDVYEQIQKSFGSIKAFSHSGSMNKMELCRRNVGNAMFGLPFTNKAQLINFGNKFYMSIDTEIINTNKVNLYNGIQTGVNSNIRLNISEALTSAMTCYYWCSYDALLEFDFMTGITRSIY